MLNVQILTRHKNDYTADMVCEHCNATHVDKYGYADHNYFDNVIPAMHCKSCGKNSAGKIDATFVPKVVAVKQQEISDADLLYIVNNNYIALVSGSSALESMRVSLENFVVNRRQR